MQMKSELESLWNELQPHGAKLVAVSKTQPEAAIAEAYAAGQRIFGESTAQELSRKQVKLPADIEWHFIGHLQSNKVKYVAPFVHCIHAVDSEKLLLTIDKEAAKHHRKIVCLLQVHLAQEASKYGFSEAALTAFLAAGNWRQAGHVQIGGLMTIASNTDDHVQVAAEFARLKNLFQQIKSDYFANDPAFCELSMGMSADYPLALQQGATLVRVGSRIFGQRVYD
jgi:pyridoxal phosphate enzyme (YggS family)